MAKIISYCGNTKDPFSSSFTVSPISTAPILGKLLSFLDGSVREDSLVLNYLDLLQMLRKSSKKYSPKWWDLDGDFSSHGTTSPEVKRSKITQQKHIQDYLSGVGDQLLLAVSVAFFKIWPFPNSSPQRTYLSNPVTQPRKLQKIPKFNSSDK